jgi:toxin CcdB
VSQFAVYRNKNRRTQSQFPFLLDVQVNLLAELKTRVVVPLTKAPKLAKRPMDRLTPIVEVDGDEYILLTPQLAGIQSTELGPSVASLAEQRQTVVAAIDFLMTGVTRDGCRRRQGTPTADDERARLHCAGQISGEST